MTRISMKALLGAGSLAVISAISLTPAAHAQGQPGTMSTAPGVVPPAGEPGYMAPNGYAPQQNAYLPPPAAASAPPQFPQPAGRFPGPKLN
jgi:hypothetical protein